MGIKTSKGKEGYYAQYKASKTWETNRKKRLERTIKNQPNNLQLKRAIDNMVYRRKTPKTKEWSADWISTAKLFKLFCGRFDKDIMSSNPETARAALAKPGPVVLESQRNKNKPTFSTKSFFSIETRLYKGPL